MQLRLTSLHRAFPCVLLSYIRKCSFSFKKSKVNVNPMSTDVEISDVARLPENFPQIKIWLMHLNISFSCRVRYCKHLINPMIERSNMLAF